jgi:predicted RNA-binding Zn ribbon-like protein
MTTCDNPSLSAMAEAPPTRAVVVLLRVRDGRGAQRSLDLPGLILGGVMALALVWGVVRAAGNGWADPTVLGSLLTGAAALTALIIWERRAIQPMVPLRLFADRAFSAGNAGNFLLTASLTAVVFFTALRSSHQHLAHH